MKEILNVKTTLNSSMGALGVGAAATAQHITFHESNLFKAIVATLGIIIACVTIYNVTLDIRIKRKKLEEKEQG